MSLSSTLSFFVLVLTTHGEEWPTGHLQAFGQTDELDIILIMLEDAEKFQNLRKRPRVTAVIDNREKGDISQLQVIRTTILGLAREVPKRE